jgi:tetratricopeptide (TPR) repeat protein
LVKIGLYIKPEFPAWTYSFSYSAPVFSFSLPVRGCALVVFIASSGCAHDPVSDHGDASRVFYTVTGEIALTRHEFRVAALQYAAAAGSARDVDLLRRAAEVTAECLQPSLAGVVAARWIEVEPAAVDAHRAAARAALDLHQVERSAAQYRVVLDSSPRGADVEFGALETELTTAGNIYGARQVADRLAGFFPASLPVLRIQALTALRADDPAAAAHSFEAALAASPGGSDPTADAARRELTQGWWRARILAGDADQPLAQAQQQLARDASADNRLDYALLLLAAQRNDAARAQLLLMAEDPGSKPVALRLLGLIDFQEDHLSAAGVRFAELATAGKFQDDAFYYLGLIAERHDDVERALRLYAQVQGGDSAVAALLHAAGLLRSHGAAPAAEELLDQLVDDEPQRAPEILVARARIYADAGDLPQADAVLEQAEEEYPDSVEIRYAIATMAEEHGKVPLALQILGRLAAQRPSDPAALNAYGYTLADHNRRLGMARRLIEKAYAAAPKNAAIQDSLGWVLFRQGHDEQALPYLRAAYADEHDADIAAHLGEVLWRMGRRGDADRIWTEASQGGTDHRLLEATRQRLHALH